MPASLPRCDALDCSYNKMGRCYGNAAKCKKRVVFGEGEPEDEVDIG